MTRLAKHSSIYLVSYFTTTSPAFFVFILGCLASQAFVFNVGGALCFHSADVLSFRSSKSCTKAHNNYHTSNYHFYHRFLLS
jgi:hypothetical protein